jgi:U3 small nucleolar RNA-associated protein 21
MGEDDQSNELLHFILALTWRLKARRDYELTQAWMTVFLRLHFDVIMENEACLRALRTWKDHQTKEKERLDNLVGYCGGVVSFLRNPRS